MVWYGMVRLWYGTGMVRFWYSLVAVWYGMAIVMAQRQDISLFG